MFFDLPAIAGFLLFATPAASLNVYNSPAELPSTIPLSCRTALSSNITCSPYFITAQDVALTTPFEEPELKQYCVDSCKTSLNSFQTTVQQRCGDKQYAFTPALNQSGSDIANALAWAFNVTCQKDKAGSAFCLPKILNATVEPCDDCPLKYEAAALGSKIGDRLFDRDDFSSRLSSCKVPATAYPIASRTSTPVTTSPDPSTTGKPTCDSKTYTVNKGDTCLSVAKANSIATDLLIYRNNFEYNCGELTAGDQLCLGDPCKLHVVQQNETCDGILNLIDASGSVTMNELTSWNPSIHKRCDNLDVMIGRGICISPPGSDWNITPGAPGSASTVDTFTPFLPTTNMIPAAVVTAAPNFTTSFWAVPTASTITKSIDKAKVSAIGARIKWCPDFSNSPMNVDALPEDCQNRWDPYCHPTDLTGPILPSPTGIPASCSPAFYPFPTLEPPS